jgi:manganese-dependent inorganic pyrophosphatase
MEAQREQEGLAFLALMVTDVVAGRSRLLCVGERRLLAALPFPRVADHDFDLGAMLSRKKQLVPLLQGLFEQVYGRADGGA